MRAFGVFCSSFCFCPSLGYLLHLRKSIGGDTYKIQKVLNVCYFLAYVRVRKFFLGSLVIFPIIRKEAAWEALP